MYMCIRAKMYAELSISTVSPAKTKHCQAILREISSFSKLISYKSMYVYASVRIHVCIYTGHSSGGFVCIHMHMYGKCLKWVRCNTLQRRRTHDLRKYKHSATHCKNNEHFVEHIGVWSWRVAAHT